jgi:MFS family permease
VTGTAAPPNPLRAYAAVTAAYWAFMLSDGALRMLVLLHFNTLGFTPIQLAWLFLLYELAGIVTNLAAGWLAARFGLAATLYGGLALQIGALVALAQLDPGGASRRRWPSSWPCRGCRAWRRTSPRCPRNRR